MWARTTANHRPYNVDTLRWARYGLGKHAIIMRAVSCNENGAGTKRMTLIFGTAFLISVIICTVVFMFIVDRTAFSARKQKG